ncbi:MAG: class F sortase [Chloroflexi bacterium]|nr:class F sortase [Chloroflexota bacterium]
MSAPQPSNPTNTPLRIDLQTPTHSEFPILLIPAAQVYADITEVYLSDEMGWDVSNLGQKVGYLQGTARPGSEHHVVLVGHVELRDGAPGVFKKLDKLTSGDIVILYVGAREIRYTVTEVFETDTYNLSVIADSTDKLLTMITCAGYDFISNTYQKRLVVQAKKI